MNYCILEAEKTLVHSDLRSIITDYIQSDLVRRNIFDVRDRIELSGHRDVIRTLFE